MASASRRLLNEKQISRGQPQVKPRAKYKSEPYGQPQVKQPLGQAEGLNTIEIAALAMTIGTSPVAKWGHKKTGRLRS
jgi:hypothetical protein